MTLNGDDLRTIDRALGIVTGVAKGNPASSVLYDAVEMIDAALDEAEKRLPEIQFFREKKRGCEFCDNGDYLSAKLHDNYGAEIPMKFCPLCGKTLEVTTWV